jgi:putative endonuclease
MYFVYLIRSLKFPKQTYVGQTDNLQERLETHNSGGSVFTASFRPWKLVSCVGFDNKEQVLEFEQYLKSGSGRAFAKKRLW